MNAGMLNSLACAMNTAIALAMPNKSFIWVNWACAVFSGLVAIGFFIMAAGE